MTYPKRFLDLMNFMFGHEGTEFTNDPTDLGGPTKMGVSIDAVKDYYRTRPQLGVNWQNITANDVRNLTQDQAMKIYYEDYYLRSGADKYKDIRDSYLLFDTAVQNGAYTAQQWYKNNGNNFYDVLDGRRKFYDNRILQNPSQIKYIEGWKNRLNDIEKNANKLLENPDYKPKYQDSITPFDEEYSGVLKPVTENLTPEQRESKRNKYLYMLNNKGMPTGLAASLDTQLNRAFTREEIGRMSPEEFQLMEHKINNDLVNGLIDNNNLSIKDYINNLAPEATIFTKELLQNLSNEDLNNNLSTLTNQQQKIGIPYEQELVNALSGSTGDVYVKSYTRADGTKVNAYTRSRPSY